MRAKLLLLFIILISSTYSQEKFPKIHPALQVVLSKTSIEERVNVYARLKDRYPLEELKQQIRNLSKNEKQKEIVKTLKNFASEKQRAILKFLKEARQQNRVTKLDILWALNIIVFSANKEVIYSLANNFAEIEEIRYDPKFISRDEGTDYNSPTSINRTIDGKDAGLVLQRVPEVWTEGYYGQGVLIASIDEDFNWDHPDVANQIWNNLGEDINENGVTIIWNGNRWVYDPGDLNGLDDDENGYVDDLIGWNFVNNNNIVTRNDATSHGTQVAGVLVGDGANGIQTGIAPQAKLMLLRIGTNSEQEQYYAWEAMQYCIDMGVDIISQSQSFHWDDTWCDENGQNCGPPNVAKFREMAELELEAGIIHFSSIGNDGLLVGGNAVPIPFNISVPGNCPPPWLHPEQTLVGGLTAMMGIGNVNAWNPNEIHSTSPYGPSSQEDYSYFWNDAHSMPIKYKDYPFNDGSMGLLKPDITAYGASTESINGTYPNFNYDSFSGTSSATAHAAGVAALLLSVNPSLTPSDLCRILKLSSIDNGETGHDNRYGAGTVDAYSAYLMAIEELPVELTSFTAMVQGNNVLIEWKTATEVNNYGFDIERSTDNSNWMAIGFVEGHGNSNSPKQYTFNDTDIQQSGAYYYRLKQIDNDGTFEYSDVVTVQVGVPNNFSLSQNYPNPFNPETRIDYTLPEQQNVSLRVYNMLGELVQELLNEVKPPGSYSVTFNASKLPSGIYVYRIQTESFATNKKMTFLK